MEEMKPFSERRKKFFGGLGSLTSNECPGKADYVKDMISGGEKDENPTLDAQDIARRNIDRIKVRRLQEIRIKQITQGIWNIDIPILESGESDSCEIDRDGGM